MEPRVRYAVTADEVSIAYLASGQGPVLVSMPSVPVGHLHLEWQQAGWRSWYDRLGANKTLVRYNARGTGLSERKIDDYSLAAHVLDLESVVDRLKLHRFAIFAPQHAGPVALLYTARHPERVSRVVLWCSYARGLDYDEKPAVQAMRAGLERDWTFFIEAASYILAGSGGEAARDLALFIRDSVAYEAAKEMLEATRYFDVSALLSQVRSPTLVIHREHLLFPDLEIGRNLASRLVDARLEVVEGSSILPFIGDMETPARVIEEFLAEDAAAYPDGLTSREGEILRLIASGKSSKEIAAELVLSARTVERHIANIYLKSGTHGRAQATAYALAHGLAPPSS